MDTAQYKCMRALQSSESYGIIRIVIWETKVVTVNSRGDEMRELK